MSLVGLSRRLAKAIYPTYWQVFVSFVIALLVLIIDSGVDILRRLGIGSQAVGSFQSNIATRFGHLLTLPVLSNLTLVAFWAGIGLAAYLVCWVFYTAFVAAQNEVTIKTHYTNQLGGTGVAVVMGIKMIVAVVLVIFLLGFSGDLRLWHILSNLVLHSVSIINIGLFVAAWVGQAVQLYGLFILLQLLLTGWYLPDPFTNEGK